jgi:hypothetical protein
MLIHEYHHLKTALVISWDASEIKARFGGDECES